MDDKYIYSFPYHLRFLTARLYCGKNVHTEKEIRQIAKLRNAKLKFYRKLIKVHKELKCKVRPFCIFVLDGINYNMIEREAYAGKGVINLYCFNKNINLSGRRKDNIITIFDTQLDKLKLGNAKKISAVIL